MQEHGKVKLFREKSLEAVESPESINDYLRVTSPGVWLVLGAVIALLIGGILWSIFGRIETSTQLAVVANGGQTVCYVPYEELEPVMHTGSVTVNGQSYSLRMGDDVNVTAVTADMNPFIRVTGNLEIGQVTVEVPVEGELEDGVYPAMAVTESLQPISLLLQR